MQSDYQQKPPLSRQVLTNTRTDGGDRLDGNHAAQPEPKDGAEDVSVLNDMSSLLERTPTRTAPMLTIDQFSMGPIVGFDQLETVVMEAVRPRQPSAPSSASGAGEPSRLAVEDEETRLLPVLRLPSVHRAPAGQARPQTLRRPPAVTPLLDDDVADLATIPMPAIPGMPADLHDMTYVDVPTQILEAVGPKSENYRAVVTKLIKSSGLYAIASLSGPAVSLILSPFLAHNMTPTNYGILAILTTLISLTAGITQLGLGSAFFRAYNYDFTAKDERRSVLASVSLLLGMVTLPISALAILFASSLSNLLFHRGDLGQLISLAAIALVAQNFTVPAFAWLRAENRALLFSMVSVVNLLINLAANILLVGFLHLGIKGALLSVAIGYSSVVVLVYPAIVIASRLRVRWSIMWSVLSFGAPQVLSVISVWVLQLSDRYLLEIFGTLAQSASYSIAYSMGSALSTLVLAPFSLAWPTAMYAIAKRNNAPEVYQKVFRWFSGVLLLAAFCLSLVSTVVFNVLFPPSYHSAAPVIPIIAESLAFYGIYTIVMIGSALRRKTWMGSIFTTIAALLNFGLNLYLIPHFGAMGAAFSTLIAYVALSVIAYIANQRIYPIPFEVGRFIFSAIAGVAIYYEIFALPLYWGAKWVWPLAFLGLLLTGVCWCCSPDPSLLLWYALNLLQPLDERPTGCMSCLTIV